MSKWKEGLSGVTPLQQTKTNLFGVIIVLIGVFFGLYVTFTNQMYWLVLILCGSLILTTVQLLASLQKFWKLKAIDKIKKGLIKDGTK